MLSKKFLSSILLTTTVTLILTGNQAEAIPCEEEIKVKEIELVEEEEENIEPTTESTTEESKEEALEEEVSTESYTESEVVPEPYIAEPIVEEVVSYAPHFNPYNVGEVSNLTKEQIATMLNGTALSTLVNAYYYYEQVYQVNAIFMMALTAEESGWGRSTLAIMNNNISGHKDPYTGDWKYYSDWGVCLEESYRLIREEYLNTDGQFYTGGNIYNINLTYCPDPINPSSWANNIVSIANSLLNKLN